MADKVYYDVTGRAFLPGPIPFKVSLIVRTEDDRNPEQAVHDWFTKGGNSFKHGDVEIDPNGEFTLTEPGKLNLDPKNEDDSEDIDTLTGLLLSLREKGKLVTARDTITLTDAK